MGGHNFMRIKIPEKPAFASFSGIQFRIQEEFLHQALLPLDNATYNAEMIFSTH